jgi:MFS family permease
LGGVSTVQAPTVPRRLGALVPVLIGITLVVSIVSSLGAPLIPSVAESLGISLDSAHWSLTSALLAGAVAAPILGRLGDGAYRRETIVGALGVVFLGSIVAGLATGLPMLVVGRTMQGVGLGLAPLAMAAARDHLPPERGTAVIGILSVSGAAGVGAGYPISGLIAENQGLHAAFFFGGVISGAALVAAALVVPSTRGRARVPLDIGGAFGIAIGLVMLLLAIGQGATWGWGSATIVSLFVGAVLVLGGWAYGQLHRTAPLVDLRQLRHRAVMTADISALILGLSMYMFLTLVTEFVQAPPSAGYGFGSTTLVAGLCLVPFSVLSLAMSRVVTPLTHRFGPSAVLTGGTLTIAAAGAFFALEHESLWEAFATMGVVGAGFGLTFAAIPGLIARAVPRSETGSAMGLYQVIRSVGFSMGSALAASVLATHTLPGMPLPSEQGYVIALWIGAGVCAVSAVISFALGRGARPDDVGALPERERDELSVEDAELASAGLTGDAPPPR